jgi:NADP-dependent 3-hydroxy acid dehydrogenase YdfG
MPAEPMRNEGEIGMQELADKTAFVTGAASGIGFALSRTFFQKPA